MELPLGPDDSSVVLLSAPAECSYCNRLAVHRIKLGLVVKRIDVAWSTVHEQKNDVLRFRRQRRSLGRKRVDERRDAIGRHGLARKESVRLQQSRERNRPKT